MLSGVIARGRGRTEGRQACHFSVTHPLKSKTEFGQKSSQPHFIPYIHHSWHTDTIYETDVVKAQDMGYQTFSDAAFHFRDVPAQCMARVVGHDQTILYERPSEVAPHAPAIQADFSASGYWLLDLDQQQ